MKRLSILMISLLLTSTTFSQSKKGQVNYQYSFFRHQGDSILTKRTPNSEYDKIKVIDPDILNRILDLESSLTKLQHGIKPTTQYETFQRAVDKFYEVAKKNKSKFDLTEYQAEYNFYMKHPVPSVEDKQRAAIRKAQEDGIAEHNREVQKKMDERARNEAVLRRRDSVKVAEAELARQREKRRNDSIAIIEKENTAFFDKLQNMDVFPYKELEKAAELHVEANSMMDEKPVIAEKLQNTAIDIVKAAFAENKTLIIHAYKDAGYYAVTNVYGEYIVSIAGTMKKDLLFYRAANKRNPQVVTPDNILRQLENIPNESTIALTVVPVRDKHDGILTSDNGAVGIRCKLISVKIVKVK